MKHDKHHDDFGHLIKDLSTRMELLHNKGSMAGKKKLDITYSQFEVLLFLHENQDKVIYQTDIEKAMKRSNPTITGILNRLEAKGYIERVKSANDHRFKQIIMTQKAIDLRDDGERLRLKREQSLTKGMTEEEIETFRRLLKVFISNMEEAIKEE